VGYKRILVPVDGSRISTRGIIEATKLAQAGGARIRLLHVIDEMVWTNAIDSGAGTVSLIDSLRDAGKTIIRNALAVAKRHHAGVDTVVVEEFGTRVADVILSEAGKWRADLIVMGTHGRRGLERMLLGSDADRVIRRSSVPVLLIPPATRRK
jgi:nucleotide-binding universal stress UspA family protein